MLKKGGCPLLASSVGVFSIEDQEVGLKGATSN